MGFAAGVFVTGRLIEYAGGTVIFILYGVCFILTFLALAVIRMRTVRSERESSGPNRKKGYRHLLSEKRVIKLLICMFFIGGTNVANNT